LSLFTVVLEYGGGTYISQAAGEDAKAALLAWLSGLLENDLREWKLRRHELQAAVENGCVALSGLTNVWCTSSSAAGGLLLINIIATRSSIIR
jgi:hypothetical protein